MFKLKKASKKVGDFDVTDNTTEWLMLERQEVADLPSFVHLHRLWVREETEDVFDNEDNLVSKGLKKTSTIMLYKGFVKDEKYIVETTMPLQYGNDHDAQQNLVKRLTQLLDAGYKMVQYEGEPKYYANERQAMVPPDLQQMMGNLAQATTQTATQATGRTLNTIRILPKKQNP